MTRIVLGVLAPLALVALVMSTANPDLDRAVAWSPFTELDRPRAFAQAVALPTGEILVVGGLDRNDPDVTNAKTELIDPLSRRVTLLPESLLGRVHQTITLGANDTVVAAGGVEWVGDHWSPVDLVDVYDAASRTWRSGAHMKDARSDHAAVTLRDGRVLVIGGNFNTTLLRSVEVYDPRQDAWRTVAPMPRARTQHTAVTLNDGRVLVLGGIDADGGATDTTFVYDPATNSWEDGPVTTIARLQQATVLLPSGDVLLAGGDGAAAGTSEIYLAKERRFVPSGALRHPRLVAQIGALPDGRVVVSGGLPPRNTEYRPMSSSELWDPRTGRWTEIAPIAAGRAWGNLVRVGASLYLVSGNGSDERAFRSVERLSIE